jgi:heptosyltransferase-1
MTEPRSAAGRAKPRLPAQGALDERGERETPRVLIVCSSGLGDVVHSLPVLHALRKTYPGAEIGWLVEDRFAGLLHGHPELTRLHVVRRREWRTLGLFGRRRARRALRAELASAGYTAAVDTEATAESARFTRWSAAATRVGFASPDGRELLRRSHTVRILPSPRLRHVAERNLSLLVPLGVRRSEPVFVFPDLGDGPEEIASFVGSVGGRYAVLHPGAAWPSRMWPVESFAELARMLAGELSLAVAVTWAGELERSRAESVASSAGMGARLAPETDLRALAALLRGAAVLVGGDSGPLHLASALGTPTVGVFGPTSGERRGPRGERARSIDAELGCADCGRRTCPYGSPNCMRSVGAAAVFELSREVVR